MLRQINRDNTPSNNKIDGDLFCFPDIVSKLNHFADFLKEHPDYKCKDWNCLRAKTWNARLALVRSQIPAITIPTRSRNAFAQCTTVFGGVDQQPAGLAV